MPSQGARSTASLPGLEWAHFVFRILCTLDNQALLPKEIKIEICSVAENSPLYPHIGRKTPAQGVDVTFSEKTVVWTTICTKDHGRWLTQTIVKDSLHEIWQDQAKAWMVGDYILMPDHMHFFCSPHDLRFSIEKWFAYWKDCFSKRHENPEWKWQRSGFHHRIRSGQEYSEKWNYLMQNPVRKGLVENTNDWPWKGTVHPQVGWI